MLEDPRRIGALLRLLPQALRAVLSEDGGGLATSVGSAAKELAAANRRGMLTGPGHYLRSRARARRLGGRG